MPRMQMAVPPTPPTPRETPGHGPCHSPGRARLGGAEQRGRALGAAKPGSGTGACGEQQGARETRVRKGQGGDGSKLGWNQACEEFRIAASLHPAPLAEPCGLGLEPQPAPREAAGQCWGAPCGRGGPAPLGGLAARTSPHGHAPQDSGGCAAPRSPPASQGAAGGSFNAPGLHVKEGKHRATATGRAERKPPGESAEASGYK